MLPSNKIATSHMSFDAGLSFAIIELDRSFRMKSLKHYLLIIAISALPFISIIANPLMLHSHDGPMHLARMPAYYKALAEGQILPRWASGFDYGYGTPLFNFYYHLPYLSAVPLMALGLGLVSSFKIILVGGFLLSGVFMFAFADELFGDLRKAYVATILYQFAPFHLIDLIVRGDTGEGLALTFLPLILFFITRMFHKKESANAVIPIAISTTLLILAHSTIGLMLFGVAFVFALLLAPSRSKRMYALLGLGLGVLFTTFFWLPIMAERKYTYGDLFMKDMYVTHFAPLWMFFVPNFTNTEKLQIGGIAVNFGIISSISILVALWQLRQNQLKGLTKQLVILSMIAFGCALFIMQPVSTFLWSNISILRAFQFPWRFLNITVFSFAVLGAAVLVKKNTSLRTVVLIALVSILSTVVYWYPPLGFDRVNERSLWNYPLNTTFFGEIDSIWSAGMRGKYPTHPFEIIDGLGTIQNPNKLGTRHTFTVIADSQVRIVDNTQFFPGWRVFVDGKKTPIEFQDQNWRGLITFSVPAGTHNIRVEFGDSPIRQVAKYISIISIITALIWSFTLRFKHKK